MRGLALAVDVREETRILVAACPEKFAGLTHRVVLSLCSGRRAHRALSRLRYAGWYLRLVALSASVMNHSLSVPKTQRLSSA